MKNRNFKDMMRKMAADARRKPGEGRRAVKVTLAALCAALMLGQAGVGTYVLAAGNARNKTEDAGTVSGIVFVSDTGSGAAGESGNSAGNASEEKVSGTAGTGGSGASGTSKSSNTTKGKKGTKEITKDETVYILAGADGSVREIIVSDWLKNGSGAATLKDVSELEEPENVKGEESFTAGKGNEKLWDAQGRDIYYQGTIDKELPVNVAVTYLLDGKKVSPQELAGKSGKVTIRFDYTNNQYEYRDIDGKKTKIYVPFAMVTGMILDNEVFSNVEVTNGKTVNDGGRTVVVGYALPGMTENLSLEDSDLEIPEYVEITADAKDFALGMTATVAANGLFGGMDLDDVDSVDSLTDALGELTDAMDQLMDGSSQLYDGLETLLDKSGELVKGVDQLASGASQLRDGVGSLDQGTAQLQDGVARLQAGLDTLTSKSGELNSGARQVFDTLLATARTQLGAAGLEVPAMTVENYAGVLDGVIASLDSDAVYQQAMAQVKAAVEAKRGDIQALVEAKVKEGVTAQVAAAVEQEVTNQVTAAVREQVEAQVIQAAAGMDKDSYLAAVEAGLVDEATQAAVEAAIADQMGKEEIASRISETVKQQMASDAVKAMIESKTAEQMAGDAIKEMIAANTEQQIQQAIVDNMAGSEVQDKLSAASEGAKSVIALKSSLDNYNVFYLGVQAYTAGVAQAAGGAGELKSGADQIRNGTGQLYAGANELCDGIQTMKSKTPALTDGIKQLRDGAQQLSDGLAEFNEEGIQKLVDAVDGGLEGLTDRLRAISEVSENYNSFAGISDDMDGQVKFIYRTDSVEK